MNGQPRCVLCGSPISVDDVADTSLPFVCVACSAEPVTMTMNTSKPAVDERQLVLPGVDVNNGKAGAR